MGRLLVEYSESCFGIISLLYIYVEPIQYQNYDNGKVALKLFKFSLNGTPHIGMFKASENISNQNFIRLERERVNLYQTIWDLFEYFMLVYSLFCMVSTFGILPTMGRHDLTIRSV